MPHESVAEHEVCFGGKEGALTVMLGTGPVGALVSGEMRLKCGPLDGRIRAVFNFDAQAVREALRDLLERPDLTGEVHIAEAEHGEFRVGLQLDHGRGVVSAHVASEYAMEDGGGTLVLTTDQTYVGEALRALDRLLDST